MKKILVTGGLGFIGSNFIALLKQTNPEYKIINVDKVTYAAHKDLIDSSIKNYYEDISDDVAIDNIFKDEQPDFVVNFAAETHVDNSIKDPLVFVKTNVLGTANLLNCSLKYGVERFVQVSTDEVYGSIKQGGFTEKSPIEPSSPYSASKAAADHLVHSYYKTYKLNVGITRCSNNYGPNQHNEKLIPHMVSKALRDEPLPVYGNGLNVRDWIHVKDHCRAVLAVLEGGKPGEVYNVGSSNEKTNIELVKTILKLLGKSEDLISYVEDRKGHDLRYAIDATKIANELFWQPVVNFNEGFKQTVEWYTKLQ
jgi:dTDP-glucose 4,6-dehydratase